MMTVEEIVARYPVEVLEIFLMLNDKEVEDGTKTKLVDSISG